MLINGQKVSEKENLQSIATKMLSLPSKFSQYEDTLSDYNAFSQDSYDKLEQARLDLQQPVNADKATEISKLLTGALTTNSSSSLSAQIHDVTSDLEFARDNVDQGLKHLEDAQNIHAITSTSL